MAATYTSVHHHISVWHGEHGYGWSCHTCLRSAGGIEDEHAANLGAAQHLAKAGTGKRLPPT